MDSRLRICIFCRQALRQSLPRNTAAPATPAKHLTRSIASATAPNNASLQSSSTQFLREPTYPRSLIAQIPSFRPARLQQRPFTSSSSAKQQQQVAVQNPRQDEEGNEMVVEITPRAADRLKQIRTTDSNPDLALRITVESGGCHGFQYLMSLIDMSKVSEEDDTVFEGPDGARVVLDEPSLELLKGSKVDYTMELIGSQFKIVDNPHATSSCGCGTSFDIKA